VFDGPPGTPAALIQKKVLSGADSGEQIINELFSSSAKGEIKAGAPTALRNLKQAYDDHLPKEAAAAAWDDLRLAFYLRAVDKVGGAGPDAMRSAILNVLEKQHTLSTLLYTPAEMAMMRRFTDVLEMVGRRNPNKSWSGVAVGTLMNDISGAVLGMLGGNTRLGKMAIETAARPVKSAYGSTIVNDAISGGGQLALPAPPVAGVLGGSAAQSK
jgi:hypothetical protein